MRSVSKERYLKDLQQTLYRLLDVYARLKEELGDTKRHHSEILYLDELEQNLEMIKTEISRIHYTLQLLKSRTK